MKHTYLAPRPPGAAAAPLALRWAFGVFHDKVGAFLAALCVRLASLCVLAPVAFVAAFLAIPADEARAHNDNSATLHVETYPLHEAARTGDLDAVNHFIIVHMADVNATTSYGDTPLHYATGDGTGVGHDPVVSVLIAAGANVNAKEDEGFTPLHNAALRDNVPVISMLIAAGADVNAKQNPDSGQTPLHEAAEGGNVLAISALIAAGASVNAKDAGGGTPLHEAARLAGYDISVTVFSALLAAGADVNAKNNNGKTPLHIVVSERNQDVALVLLAFGADVHIEDDEGYPALIEAAYYGLLDVVNRLLELGADVNAKGDDGWTALHEAAFNAHLDVVNRLLESGGNVNATISSGEFSGATPLEVASRRKHENVRDRLIESGGHWGEACESGNVVNPAGPSPPCVCESPNVETNLGACEVVAECDSPSVLNARTNRCDCPAPNVGTDEADAPGDCHAENALHEAAGMDDLDAVNHLISVHMADVNATTSYGETPLHKAAHNGPASIVSVLLAAGAEVSIKRSDGETPLHLAAGNGHADIASMLLSAGADVNAEDNYGNTPLHEPDTASVASVLIAAGANVNAKNQYGDTPLRDVVSWASLPIISVLIAAGGHWGEACENAAVVNPAGPSPPCVCESPNVETNLGACEVVAECASPAVLNAGANRCDCPAPNVETDGAEAPGECAAPSAQVCGGLTPAKFYDSEAGECGDRLYPCHDSAIRKADNSGCECPDGTFAHGDPSAWSTVTTLTLSSAVCYADHAPIQHDINGWLDSVLANNPTLIAHFIFGHGQNPDRTGWWWTDISYTALHLAAQEGFHQAAKALIEGGADIERKSFHGNAPLHLAVREERAELITLLLQRGADADAKGDDGDTALHLAARRTDAAENAGLIAFLLDAGADPEYPQRRRLAASRFGVSRGDSERLDLAGAAGDDGGADSGGRHLERRVHERRDSE